MGRARSRASTGRTQSIANPRVFTSPADKIKKTANPDAVGKGEQGRGTCPKCGVTMTLRKVTVNNPSRFGDLPIGTAVMARHRPGGGAVARSSFPCAGDGVRPVRVSGNEVE